MTQITLKLSRIGETIYALCEDDIIQELKIIRAEHSALKTGAIYGARIGKIDPRISAAFVDCGDGIALLPFGQKRPKYLVEGRGVIVKITRPPLGDKSAICTYIGDAAPKQAIPAIIESANDWGNWPKPIEANQEQAEQMLEAINNANEKTFAIPKGGNLSIEATRALIAIDIDAGGRIAGGTNQSNFNHKLNMDAAALIARLIKLYNHSGLIVIDFVGAPSRIESQALFDALLEGLTGSNKFDILPISKFGLCEIARQRNGNSISEIIAANCAQSIAINAINELASALLRSKGAVLCLNLNAAAAKYLENAPFDWKNHLQEKVGGLYEINSQNIDKFEIVSK